MTEPENITRSYLTVDQKLILSLISLIDLTTLGNTDTPETVSEIIKKANEGFQGTHPAAVCTYPSFGNMVKEELVPFINSAVVGGCFPTGQTLSAAKIEEVKIIAGTQTDEIDVVLNRGDFFAGNFAQIEAEISGMKKAAGQKLLKVILETGELQTVENIRKASDIAIKSGADFIKTSTGKVTVGATPEAVYTMCQTISAHFENTGKAVGIKPSGGIRTLQDAVVYYKIVARVLGKKWLTPKLFRIGASSLYDNLKNAYQQLNTP